MSELAKTTITITDESSYPAGTASIIPLYVFATEQDKVIDEDTGEIASGTTKAVANKLMLLTSQNDVINTFGTPLFTVKDGTVQQGDELNETGLYGLYDGLGSTSLAYALRADIDLKQLKASTVEPTGTVANGTEWLDLGNSCFGLFRANGDKRSANAWDQITGINIYNSVAEMEASTFEVDGDIAIVVTNNTMKFYEKVAVIVEGVAQEKFVLIDGNSGSEWSIARSYTEGSETKTPIVVHSSHTKVPSGLIKGSIWFKTSTPLNGAKILLKTYRKSEKHWNSAVLPVFGSYLDAEKYLIASLAEGSKIIKYDDDKVGCYYVSTFLGNEYNIVETNIENPTAKIFVKDSAMNIKTIAGGVIETSTDIIIPNESVNLKILSKMINAQKIDDINSYVTDAGQLRIVNLKGYTIVLNDRGTGHLVSEDLELKSGAEYAGWTEANVKCQETEPTASADEGTYWFNNSYKVDIMVNDGEKWVGFKNYADYADATIYVQSSDPCNDTTVAEYSLWLDTSATSYPRIYRFYNEEWELIDNTDQSSSLGIVFADARANAGYALNNATDMATMMVSDYVDPNTPNPQSYPEGILLFNTLYSTNNVKEYIDEYSEMLKESASKTYTVGSSEFYLPGTTQNPGTMRWHTISGNKEDGEGYFGSEAQRIMVVRALQSAIKSNEDIRSDDYDFFFACCPGYPEVDDELINLNTDKKEMFMIVADTPAKLAPNANDIKAWGSNANNATVHGSEGRVLRTAYATRAYPSCGLTSNIDGSNIAIPTSIAKMKNLLVLPRGMAAAGTQYGQVTNLASVGYITDENEYASVSVKDSLGEVIGAQNINPIMSRRNTGLLFWGMDTENPITSALSDEPSILTLLRLKRELDEACLPFFFKPNIESVRQDFHNALQTILADYVSRNELYDFALVTDDSVNTNETIERGELWANIGLSMTKFVKEIFLPIRIVRTGSLSEE